MAATFTAVDLSRLPAPALIETLSYERIYADMIARLRELLPSFDATVESDPAVKVLQVAAYREFLIRARVNDAGRAVMPAFATGADLDQLAALMSVARLELTPADPDTDTPAVMESDDDFRRRLVLAPEGYSVAGPEGAYIFHALSAAPDVMDASATSPAPGEVVVTVLSRLGNGTAPPALLDTVLAYVGAETRRPLTDFVTVRSAEILVYQVEARIVTFAGPDAELVMAEARRRLDAYVADARRLGRDVTRSGLFGALHAPGVQNVVIVRPVADVVASRTQAAFCTGIDIRHFGIAE